MKNHLIALCTCMFIACSSPANYTSGMYTIEKYDACVNPVEEQFLSRYATKIYRHVDCMGVENLVSVVWVGKKDDDSIMGAKLIALGYTTSYNKSPRDNPYCVSYLDVGSFRYGKTKTGHAAFFRLDTCSSTKASI